MASFGITSLRSIQMKREHIRTEDLTEKERQLFHILEETIAWKGRSTVPRVAGGWVRDKLLGIPSMDIDIALDDQTGVEFATSVNEYLSHIGTKTRSLAVIQANPDQSKHLETVNLKVAGFEIDFVNLRAEAYSETSRIPQIRFGSPLDDALRRDFTINSLFYNIRTKEVEDFSSHGLSDLRMRIIRTPLPALETFRDDPLRVLRSIRFASRLSFELHEDIIHAVQNPVILEALANKISKERVLKELEGMLKIPSICSGSSGKLVLISNNAHMIPSLASISTASTDMYSVDLELEDRIRSWMDRSIDVAGWCALLDCLRYRRILMIGDNITTKVAEGTNSGRSSPTHTLGEDKRGPKRAASSSPTCSASPNPAAESSGRISPPLDYIVHATRWAGLSVNDVRGPYPSIANTENRRAMFIASLVAGLADIGTLNNKLVTTPVVMTVLRDSLKLDTETIKNAVKLFESSAAFQLVLNDVASMALLERIATKSVTDFSTAEIRELRGQLGLVLRNAKELWRTGIVMGCAMSISDSQHAHSSGLQGSMFCAQLATVGELPDIPISENISCWIYKYSILQMSIEALGLDDCWSQRPLLDGNQIAKDLSLPRGPMLGKMMDLQVRWQLRYPQGTIEELLEFLRQNLSSIP